MSCCGQKRLALVTPPSRRPASPAPALAVHPMMRPAGTRADADVGLRYLGLGPFSWRGVRTGRVYTCSGTGDTMRTDPADADVLLRTRLFARG